MTIAFWQLRFMLFAVSPAVALVLVTLGESANANVCETEKVRIGGLTHYHSSYSIAAPPKGYQHDKYGTEPIGLARQFAAFVSSFDLAEDDNNGDGEPDSIAQPAFVAYEMRATAPDGAGRFRKPDTWDRPERWYTEATDELDFVRETGDVRPRIDDSYSGIGNTWNRGHLAMKLHAERISHEAACNTHFFWNSMPQAALLNQGPWLDLEYWTGAAANKFGAVWIVTGPIFKSGKKLEWIGDDDEIAVAIPDEVFKLVVREGEPGELPSVLAFIYPNNSEFTKCSTTTSARSFGAYDHTEFLVEVGMIETRTGLTFFNELSSNDRSALLAQPRGAMWDIEEQVHRDKLQPVTSLFSL